MLPPFIIEQIRKREREERSRREQQPQLDIPLQMPLPCGPDESKEDVERGVVILEV